MDNSNGERITYANAGFNSFLSRRLNSQNVANIKMLSQAGTQKELNFDQYRVTGSLGDKLQVGRIVINGADGRIEFNDEQGVEIGRAGDLS